MSELTPAAISGRDPVAASASGAEALPANPWPGAIAIMLGTMMVYLDTTVVNLSLPHMAGSLSATVNEATWSLTSYLAANAVVLPMTGWLAGLVGRKRLILLGLAGFILASLLCGAAFSMTAMVVFRILQGLTGGVLQPLSQAVLLESFPVEERGKAMGFWSAGIVLAPVIGPVVGGYLTESHSWRWVFFINVPIGILSLVLVQIYLVDPAYIKRRLQRIDWTGILLLIVGIGALQVMLDKGQEEDWLDSPLIVALLVVGGAALLAFVRRALRIAHTVVDLRVFGDPTFAVGSLLSALVGFLLYGSIVVLPLLLQTLLGHPPLRAGFAIAPRGLGALVAFPIVGLLADRYDARKLLLVGLALGAITMFWFSTLDQDLGPGDLLAPQLVQGVALGFLFVPLSTATMYPIPRHQMGNATSLFNVIRNFGSSIGIAVVATYLARSRVIHQEALRVHVDPMSPETVARFEQLRSWFLQNGVDPTTAADQALAAMAATVGQQAAMLSFLDTFRLFAWVFVAMVPLVFLMRAPVARETG